LKSGTIVFICTWLIHSSVIFAATPPADFTLLGKDSPLFAAPEAENEDSDLAGCAGGTNIIAGLQNMASIYQGAGSPSGPLSLC
jgi:hypothetical protein